MITIFILDLGLHRGLIVVWAVNLGADVLPGGGRGLAALAVHLQQLAKVETRLLQHLDLRVEKEGC